MPRADLVGNGRHRDGKLLLLAQDGSAIDRGDHQRIAPVFVQQRTRCQVPTSLAAARRMRAASSRATASSGLLPCHLGSRRALARRRARSWSSQHREGRFRRRDYCAPADRTRPLEAAGVGRARRVPLSVGLSRKRPMAARLRSVGCRQAEGATYPERDVERTHRVGWRRRRRGQLGKRCIRLAPRISTARHGTARGKRQREEHDCGHPSARCHSRTA